MLSGERHLPIPWTGNDIEIASCQEVRKVGREYKSERAMRPAMVAFAVARPTNHWDTSRYIPCCGSFRRLVQMVGAVIVFIHSGKFQSSLLKGVLKFRLTSFQAPLRSAELQSPEH